MLQGIAAVRGHWKLGAEADVSTAPAGVRTPLSGAEGSSTQAQAQVKETPLIWP